MPLKKDLTVLTVSFCEKRKEMKMLDQTIVPFFLRDRSGAYLGIGQGGGTPLKIFF